MKQQSTAGRSSTRLPFSGDTAAAACPSRAVFQPRRQGPWSSTPSLLPQRGGNRACSSIRSSTPPQAAVGASRNLRRARSAGARRRDTTIAAAIAAAAWSDDGNCKVCTRKGGVAYGTAVIRGRACLIGVAAKCLEFLSWRSSRSYLTRIKNRNRQNRKQERAIPWRVKTTRLVSRQPTHCFCTSLYFTVCE